jgi:hypothetical protein
MLVDGDTDWAELAELLTDSFWVLAPQKLIAVARRSDPTD